MSQKLNVGILGLNTNANLETLPDGTLVNVKNMNVDRKLAEGRRGFSKHSTIANVESITEYQDKLIVRTTDNALKYYNAGWNTYSGTFSRPTTNVRTRFIQANQNLYFNTSTGIKVLDAYNGTVYSTGMPKGLDGFGAVMTAGTFTANTNDTLTYTSHGFLTGLAVTVSTTTTLPGGLAAATTYYIIKIDTDTFYLATSYANALAGTQIDITSTGTGTHTVTPTGSASGFMATNTQVAYRIVWGARDANSNLYLGAPSQRIIVANSSGGTKDVTLQFTVPSGITTSDFFQVYRSRQSASSTTEPDDELSLVYEENPTAGEIAALSITFTDSTDDTLKGAYLYTNANQEGISESNDIPPFAMDITNFKGFTFFSNIKTKYSIGVDLLATGGSSGLVANDTITINGMVFTAKAATTVANREFKVFTAGSAAQNVEDTAKELVKVVNQYTSNTTIYAYYESGFDDLPGQIKFEERTLSGTAFTVSVSRTTCWTLDNSGTATNSEFQHGIMWSKAQQPEHVPSSHLEFVGSKSYAIKRILPLKDSLFILKEDGLFRLTGTNGSWSIEGFDSSTIIIAPESAIVINNQIICLSNQGVVSISDVGVQVIGEDIKDSIQALIGTNYDNLQNYTFAVGYDTDRKYILSTISASSDTSATQQWIYNVFTNKWSRWERTVNCGLVAPSNDKLYFADSTQMLEERKSFTYKDFVDEEFGSYSVVSSSGTNVVLDTIIGLEEGDLLYESSSVYSPIIAIDATNNTVTVNDVYTWAVSSITVLRGIDYELEWSPSYCENGGVEKSFSELQMMFKKYQFRDGTIDFYTDTNGGFEEVAVDGQYGGGLWGLFGWGGIPWGGEFRASPIRVSVPRNKSRGQLLAIRFSCRVAYSWIVIEGYSLQFDFVSERQGSRLG